MNCVQRLLCVCVGLFFLAGLTSILSLAAPETASQVTPANPQVADQTGSGEALWKNGELLPPLPVDPVRRAEAIRLAKEAGRALEPSSAPAQTAGSWTTGAMIHPIRVTATKPSHGAPYASPRSAPPLRRPLRVPAGPFVPTAEQLRESARDLVNIGEPRATPSWYGVTGAFDAIDYTGWTPPSPDIAVGPDHILVATTDVFAVYDKCGNWIDGGVIDEYFPLSSSYTYYNPRVIYDDWNGRWVMAYMATDVPNHESRIVYVVSNTADLGDGWGSCTVSRLTPAGSFSNDVYMSVDPEALYFTYNQFHFDTNAYEGAVIVALNKLDVYNFQPTVPVWFSCSTNPGDGTLADSVRPAQMHSYGGKMYFLNNKSQGGTIFTLWSLDSPFTSPVFSKTSVSVSAYALPPQMRQANGTYVDAGDCRLADLVYDAHSLYTAFPRYLNSGGNEISQISVWVFGVSPIGYQKGQSFYVPSSFVGYPSLEIEESGRVGFQYTYSSFLFAKFLSTAYIIWDFDELNTVDSGDLAVGLANYTQGGSGTAGNPYAWGNYTGCAVDPVDDRTFWMLGAYASNDPTPSWMTHVGAVSGFVWSNLVIEPSALVTGGVYGESITKNVLPLTLSNSSQTDLHWEIDQSPWWITPSAMTGQIPPGGTQVISLFVDEEARWLPAGVYNESVHFNNCTGYGSGSCTVGLTIVEPITCPYAVISTAPPATGASAVSGTAEYSVFVTAMEDIAVCAMGLALADPEPAGLACTVYEANGTTRGPMLYSNSQFAVQAVGAAYLVPMGLELEACQDYEIAFTHSAAVAHLSYSEAEFSYPFDVNGIIRVRQSATNGSVTDPQHPAIVICGTSSRDPVSGHTTDLYPDETEHTVTSVNSCQGLFITARENLYLCSIGFEADVIRDQWLIARVFETGAGYMRTSLVAEGYARVGTGGLTQHEIPIHARIKAGQEYNVSVTSLEKGYWPAVAESEVTLPYTVHGDIEVRKGEFNGFVSSNLPNIRLDWEDTAVRGVPFDLAKSAGGIPAPNTGSGAIDHGAFVEPAVTQEVYSLGVHADIPEGTTVTARIYRLNAGDLRGPLQTEGSIKSGGSGMRWHDVPVALQWQGGTRYDLSIVCSNTTEYRYWLDTTGMPYTPYGVIQVRNAEAAGNAIGTVLIHMRVNACGEVATAIGDDSPPVALLSLEPPVPNPANGLVRFRYTVDEPGAADLEIYDVAGRRVARVFNGRPVEAGPGEVDFDTTGLTSGVYFLKLTIGGKDVSRKIVVMR
jgi:hypothetical protein